MCMMGPSPCEPSRSASEIETMRARHAEEIKGLQYNCTHEIVSDWMDYMWAPGHCGSQVKVCKRCDKIIEQQPNNYIIEDNK